MHRRALPWIIAAATGFGVGFPISKWLFESGLDVWKLFIPRYVIGTAIILAAIAGRRRRRSATAIRQGGVLGIVNVTIPTVLLTFGTDLLPASVVGVLVAIVPPATAAAAHWLVPGERFSAALVPGLALASFGVAVFATGGVGTGGSSDLLGFAVTLLGVVFAGVGGALTRRYASGTPAADLAIPQFLAATAAMTAVSWPMGGADLSGVSFEQWLGIGTMGTVSTALPFFALLKAAEHTTAVRASMVGYLAPIVGATTSIIFLDEPLSGTFAAGAALVGVGVFLTARRPAEPAVGLNREGA